MAEKPDKVKFTLPEGVAIYPRLTKPDVKWKPEGEYSAKVRLAPDAIPESLTEALEALLEKKRNEVVAKLTADKKMAKVKSLKVRAIFTPEVDKESGDETGNVVVNAKMRATGVSKKDGTPWARKPRLFDSKGKVLVKAPNVYGGSILKVAGEAMAYYTPKDNEIGIAFYLEAVQIIKLVEGGARAASDYGFGASEDGYVDESEQADDGAPGEPGAEAADADATDSDKF